MTSDSPHPSRRALLGSAVATAGFFIAASHTQADNPGSAVADRTSSIRIQSVRAFPVGAKVYIKVSTNQKIHGWGEITGLEPKVAAVLAESLLALLENENPTRIEYLWQKIYRAHRDMRGGPFMTHTLSAIDMALWDITGKLWGVPVFRLLGGPVRDRIHTYPHAKAFKQAAGGSYPFASTPANIDGLVERVAEARKKVGHDGAVMFDAHCCLPPPTLIQFAAAIKPYDVMWIEEPAVPGNIEVFKRLKAAIDIPLATGERDRTIWEMIPYLEQRCIDILQPDCGHCGGISQMRKIAALAEAYQVPLAPHCTMSPLGLTASLHAAAATPLFLIHEAYTDGHIMPAGVANVQWEKTLAGDIVLPEVPGLGVEIDEARAAAVNADPKRQYKWPLQRLSDGSIADY